MRARRSLCGCVSALPSYYANKMSKKRTRALVKQEIPDEEPAAAPAYKEEVLGQKLEIMFENDKHQTSFYSGIVDTVQMKLDDRNGGSGGGIQVSHFIKFDGGDERWFDLGGEEREGRLRWLEKKPAKVKREAGLLDEGPRVKREDGSDGELSPEIPEKKIKVESGLSVAVVKEEGKDPDQEVEIDTALVPDQMPSSITEVIRFMDKLEPDQGHYQLQADSRGECSGTRGKLRRFARKNPDHPAIRHWVATRKWQPPDTESLFALMELIKTMIR